MALNDELAAAGRIWLGATSSHVAHHHDHVTKFPISPALAFYAASCRDCVTSDAVLTVTALSVDSRQRVKSKDLTKQPVSPQEHAALWQAV